MLISPRISQKHNCYLITFFLHRYVKRLKTTHHLSITFYSFYTLVCSYYYLFIFFNCALLFCIVILVKLLFHLKKTLRFLFLYFSCLSSKGNTASVIAQSIYITSTPPPSFKIFQNSWPVSVQFVSQVQSRYYGSYKPHEELNVEGKRSYPGRVRQPGATLSLDSSRPADGTHSFFRDAGRKVRLQRKQDFGK